jgi:hypothetical protein
MSNLGIEFDFFCFEMIHSHLRTIILSNIKYFATQHKIHAPKFTTSK